MEKKTQLFLEAVKAQTYTLQNQVNVKLSLLDIIRTFALDNEVLVDAQEKGFAKIKELAKELQRLKDELEEARDNELATWKKNLELKKTIKEKDSMVDSISRLDRMTIRDLNHYKSKASKLNAEKKHLLKGLKALEKQGFVVVKGFLQGYNKYLKQRRKKDKKSARDKSQ